MIKPLCNLIRIYTKYAADDNSLLYLLYISYYFIGKVNGGGLTLTTPVNLNLLVNYSRALKT